MSSNIVQLKDNEGNDIYPITNGNLVIGNLDTISYSEKKQTIPSPIYNLLNTFYPIGTICWLGVGDNPSTLFGGTWEKIEEKFILTAGDTYINNTTGGNFTHLHGEHNKANGSIEAMVGSGQGDAYSLAFLKGNHSARQNSTYKVSGSTVSTPSAINSHNTSVWGKTAESSSMPPYVVKYCWERIK